MTFSLPGESEVREVHEPPIMEAIHPGLSNGPTQKGLSKFGVKEVHLGYKKKKISSDSYFGVTAGRWLVKKPPGPKRSNVHLSCAVITTQS